MQKERDMKCENSKQKSASTDFLFTKVKMCDECIDIVTKQHTDALGKLLRETEDDVFGKLKKKGRNEMD